MSQKGITNQEEILIFAWESALMNDEIAFSLITFVKILLWVYFKDEIAHLEANWFDLRGYLFTWLFNVAESFIWFAIKIWKSSCPLQSNFLKNIWRDGKLRTSSVNNCWITCVLSRLLHSLSSIVHSLSFKSPCSKPIWEIFECFQSFRSSYNLWRIIASKKSVWSLTHILAGNTKTDHSMINNSIILQRPEIMKFLFAHILVWRKTKNTIWVGSKTLRFIKSQELEVGTFVLLELEFKFN